MKKIITAVAMATTLGASMMPVAYANEDKKGFFNQVRQERKDFHQNVKEDRKDFQDKMKDMRKDFKASEAAKIKDFKAKNGHLTNVTITAVNSSSFTVTNDGKTVTVNTSSKTRFIRHFWGKSTLAELAVGDKVNVWGKWTDDAQTTFDASMVRNLSVMKRFGVFFGQITSLGSGSFVVHTVNRGDQTVSYGSTTKFVNRKEAAITASDLKVGDKIRVKGMWDKANNKITEVTQVKDFSLPQKATTTPTPTVSVTVAPTATPTVAVTATPTP